MKSKPLTSAADFWNSCRDLNTFDLGSARWTAAFQNLVKIASTITATGAAARRFLHNQCGITITVEETQTGEYPPVDEALDAALICAASNDQ